MSANEIPPDEQWRFPTRGVMEALIVGHKPRLQIESLVLRHAASQRERAQALLNRAREMRNGSGPDWLPRPDEFRVPVQVKVHIHHRANTKAMDYIDVKNAEVIRVDNSNCGPAVFIVELKSPFSIEFDKLYVTKQVNNRDDTQEWKHMPTDRYTLEIAIQPKDSKAAAEFLSQLEAADISKYNNTPGSESIIRAVWGEPNTKSVTSDAGLPKLPFDEVLLPLRRAQGHKSLAMSYGLEAKMGWGRHEGTVLDTYNRNNRNKREKSLRKRQLPTPNGSGDLEHLAKKKREVKLIKYTFRGRTFVKRMVQMPSLKCVLCRDDGREHSSFERLLAHYLTNHQEWEMTKDDDEDNSEVKNISMKLEDVHSQSELSAAEERDDEKNFDWEAPRNAFDVDDYANGGPTVERWSTRQLDRSRTRGAPAVKKSNKTQKGKTSGKTNAMARTPPVVVLEKRKTRDMAPEDVEDLPPRKRRQHQVPAVEGIKFYRTTSKRILEPGEWISDSDDEVDDAWLVEIQRRDLIDLGNDYVELEFNEMFNRHLDLERPMSDTLTRDAIVRFTRKFASKLGKPVWRDVLETKLEQLRTRQVLQQRDKDYCMGILPVVQEDPVVEEPANETVVDPTINTAETVVESTAKTMDDRTQSLKRRENLFATASDKGRFTKPTESTSREASASRAAGPSSEPQTPSAARRAMNGDAGARSAFGTTAPDSPDLTPNTKMRKRWKHGAMVQSAVDEVCGENSKASAGPETVSPTKESSSTGEKVPLGLRTVLCRRSGLRAVSKKRDFQPYEFPIAELIHDNIEIADAVTIQPRHLDFAKLKRVLDRELIYDRSSDIIVCVSDAVVPIVTDDADWFAALEASLKRTTERNMVFELHEHESYTRLLAQTQSQPRSQTQTSPKPQQPTEHTDQQKGKEVVDSPSATAHLPVKSAAATIGRTGEQNAVGDKAARRRICDCGKMVLGLSGTMMCGKPGCSRTFHMLCMGVQFRSVDWVCPECCAVATAGAAA